MKTVLFAIIISAIGLASCSEDSDPVPMAPGGGNGNGGMDTTGVVDGCKVITNMTFGDTKIYDLGYNEDGSLKSTAWYMGGQLNSGKRIERVDNNTIVEKILSLPLETLSSTNTYTLDDDGKVLSIYYASEEFSNADKKNTYSYDSQGRLLSIVEESQDRNSGEFEVMSTKNYFWTGGNITKLVRENGDGSIGGTTNYTYLAEDNHYKELYDITYNWIGGPWGTEAIMFSANNLDTESAEGFDGVTKYSYDYNEQGNLVNINITNTNDAGAVLENIDYEMTYGSCGQ